MALDGFFAQDAAHVCCFDEDRVFAFFDGFAQYGQVRHAELVLLGQFCDFGQVDGDAAGKAAVVEDDA